jgi:hypothetical protein
VISKTDAWRRFWTVYELRDEDRCRRVAKEETDHQQQNRREHHYKGIRAMPTNVEIDVTHYETKMRELLARAEENDPQRFKKRERGQAQWRRDALIREMRKIGEALWDIAGLYAMFKVSNAILRPLPPEKVTQRRAWSYLIDDAWNHVGGDCGWRA